MGSVFSACSNAIKSIPQSLQGTCATLFIMPVVANIGELINKFITYTISCRDGVMYYSIEFDITDNKNFQLKDAIFREIRSRDLHLTDHLIISDGYIGQSPNIEISNGTYKFCNISFTVENDINGAKYNKIYNIGSIYVIISDAKIVLQLSKGWYDYLSFGQINKISTNIAQYKLFASSSLDCKIFKQYIDQTYLVHNKPETHMMIFVAEQNNWKHAGTRCINSVDNPVYTNDMNDVLTSVGHFLSSETEKKYAANNIPYRKGYLLHGGPGTGKTALINIIAIVNGMRIYMVQLNSKDMTDAVLTELLMKVPPRSLIVFDEIDQQYATIIQNKNINISIGGIFSAIDGPARLSHGTIVIFTSNQRNCIPENYMPILLRSGRIDHEFCLNEPFNLPINN
jgi:hypothetical protein